MAVTKFLSREELLSGRVFRTVEVDAGPLGKVRLRHLTPEELLSFTKEEREDVEAMEASTNGAPAKFDAKMGERAMLRFASMFCGLALDENNKRLLTDDDAKTLVEKLSASIIMDGFRKVVRATNAAMAEAGEK